MYFLRFSIISVLLFFVSCDDGDIIVSDFEFDEDSLETCYSGEDDNHTVFYNVNDDNEVIYVIIDGEFDFMDEFDSTVDSTSDVINDDTNLFRYLKFDSFSTTDANDFFCSAVATTKTITRELNGTGGTLSIVTLNTVDIDGGTIEDEDGDGLTNEQEGYIEGTPTEDFDTLLDSDQDGIPNFRDQDDDNDNVTTANELFNKDDDGEDIDTDDDEDGIPDAGFLDTDGDGNPDYLDTDDDEDGVPTRLEFVTGASSLSPEFNLDDADKLARYLDDTVAIAGEHTEPIQINNSYTTNYETIVKISDLELSSSSEGTVTYDTLVIGEENVTSNLGQIVFLYSDNTFETLSINSETGETEEPSGTGDPIVNVPNDEITEEEETDTP